VQDIAKRSKKMVDTESEVTSTHKKLTGKKVAMWVIVALVVLGSVGAAGFFYKEARDLKADPKSAITEKNQAETTRVLDSLKKRLFIGESDAPTVARVEDPEKLKKSNAEFYKDIQVGDYLVIYPKRAIVYRESNDQIINVAPIINTSDLQTKSSTTVKN
jgi:hypothetical protein